MPAQAVTLRERTQNAMKPGDRGGALTQVLVPANPPNLNDKGARLTDESQGLVVGRLLCESGGRRERLTEAKRRRQGLVVCRAALPFEGL
jgi:hypothetical protein